MAVDPHMREALRYRLMILRTEADQRTVDDPDFDHPYREWSACSHNEDAFALLEALDPPHVLTGDIRAGRLPRSPERVCTSGGTAAELTSLRGLHHATVASANLAVVSTWVDLIDAQAERVDEVNA